MIGPLSSISFTNYTFLLLFSVIDPKLPPPVFHNQPNMCPCVYCTEILFRVGDEILEWNGRALHGRSSQEVNDIIRDIGHDTQQLELIVSRLVPHGNSNNYRSSSANQQIPSGSKSFREYHSSSSSAAAKCYPGRGTYTTIFYQSTTISTCYQ